VLGILGRPISTPPAWRQSIGALPLATSGLLTLSVPACILLDAGDSKVGLDIIGKGKWKLVIVKTKDASPTVSSDLSADIGKAAADTVTGLNAEAKLKARLELTPMLHFGPIPVSGLYLNPGINIKATAKATPLKQGICASATFNSELQFWLPGVRTDLMIPQEISLVSDKLLLGDTCDPTDPTPAPPAPGVALACDASFEPFLSSLPAFASPDMNSAVAGARLDAANFLANPGAVTLAQIEQQAAAYRSTQADLERLYLQVNSGQPVSQLCASSQSAPSTAGLIDSIAIAWGSVRIGLALDAWGSNRLQCMQSGGTFKPAPLEPYCPR
jgi:hypothetical protein